jgi:hypothetical protein
MDPITIGVLTGLAGGAVSSLPQLMPSRLARENRARLEELKKKEEMDALGLTEKEAAAFSSQLRGAGEAAQQSSENLQKRLLAGGGMATGGQALIQSAAAEQARMKAETDIADRLLQLDLEKERAQKEEMRALEAGDEARRRELASAAAGILGSGLVAGLTTAAQQAVIQGSKDISPEKIASLSQQLGVSEAEARGIFEISLENPELLKYMSLMQGGEK